MNQENVKTNGTCCEPRAGTSRRFRPEVDITETESAIIVEANIPGSSSESIDVSFENGVLTLQAKVAPRQEQVEKFVSREYGIGDYFREFQVRERIDEEKISASYVNGVLTLTLPKAEEVRPKKINVTAH